MADEPRPTREREAPRDEDREMARRSREAPDPHVRDWHDHRGSSRSRARSSRDSAPRRGEEDRRDGRDREPSRLDDRPRRSRDDGRRSDDDDDDRRGGARSRSRYDDGPDPRGRPRHEDRWRPGRRGPSPDRGYSRGRDGYSRGYDRGGGGRDGSPPRRGGSSSRRDHSRERSYGRGVSDGRGYSRERSYGRGVSDGRGYSRDRDDRGRSGSRGPSSSRRPSHPRQDDDADTAPRGTSVAEILARVKRGEPATPAPAPAPAPAPVPVPAAAPAAPAAEDGASSSSSSSSAPAPAPSGLPESVAAAIAALSSKALAAGAADEDAPDASESSGPAPSVLPESAAAQATKALREVYIGNLPPGTTGPQLTAFLNQQLATRGLVVPGGGPAPVGGLAAREGPVIGCRVNAGAQFGFAEFRCIEETVLALSVGELALGALQLRFGRPRAFVTSYGDDTPHATAASAYILSLVAAGVPDRLPRGCPAGTAFPETAERLRDAQPGAPFALLPPPPQAPSATPGSMPPPATGLPLPASSAPAAAPAAPVGIPSLPMPSAAAPAPPAGPAGPDRSCPTLEVSGALENFEADDVSEMFGGFGAIRRCEVRGEGEDKRAVVEFVGKEDAASAQASLDGLEVGDGALAVRLLRVDEPLACAPSRHVVIRNTVLRSEMESDEDWAEVSEDIAEEARRHGAVQGLAKPKGDAARPAPGDEASTVPVYLTFSEPAAAAAAAQSMTDRRFDGRLVTAHCVPDDVFQAATA